MMTDIKTQLAQKELENHDLKRKVLEWKKKALEQEALYHATVQQHQVQEQQLIAHYQAEMDALMAVHVEKMDRLSSKLLSLQQQPERLVLSQQVHDFTEEKHKETASRVMHHRQKATDLILNMNELMSAIETKIHGYIDDNDDRMDSEEEEPGWIEHSSRKTGTVTPPPDHHPSMPRLKSKPTVEHLSKVIPSFLKSAGKSEQWKMTSRTSIVRSPSIAT